MKKLLETLYDASAISAILSFLNDDSGNIISDLGWLYLNREIELETFTD